MNQSIQPTAKQYTVTSNEVAKFLKFNGVKLKACPTKLTLTRSELEQIKDLFWDDEPWVGDLVSYSDLQSLQDDQYLSVDLSTGNVFLEDEWSNDGDLYCEAEQEFKELSAKLSVFGIEIVDEVEEYLEEVNALPMEEKLRRFKHC
tara:strand:- start:205 stop:642 length:438 start_codon:yes stop_codon:yes gene_type:complete